MVKRQIKYNKTTKKDIDVRRAYWKRCRKRKEAEEALWASKSGPVIIIEA
jgi:hypothetical protein